jgi:hypothetical protein
MVGEIRDTETASIAVNTALEKMSRLRSGQPLSIG